MGSLSKTIDDVDSVFRFLAHHREQAIQRLFPGQDAGTEAYRQEWLARDSFGVWCHLDGDNRRRLVTMAIEHYAPMPK
jgi:hypothetical protein